MQLSDNRTVGQNLILNAADHGFTVVAYNRTVSKVDRFLDNEAKGKSIVGMYMDVRQACEPAKLTGNRRPLHEGVRLQAQEAPQDDDARHGRQARRWYAPRAIGLRL